jgi:hypothetical protein
MQGCEQAVGAEVDGIEIGKRQTQEKDLQAMLLGSESDGPIAAHWFNATFDESGVFLIFPSWRGIAIANVASGKVRFQRAALSVRA